jgi:hypothetical protein
MADDSRAPHRARDGGGRHVETLFNVPFRHAHAPEFRGREVAEVLVDAQEWSKRSSAIAKAARYRRCARSPKRSTQIGAPETTWVDAEIQSGTYREVAAEMRR